uniref:Uncharacterized protein n=1 Tax=Rhizophora mucronata TaxID=61149 RepID=A0A2P2PH92_RHIMU
MFYECIVKAYQNHDFAGSTIQLFSLINGLERNS